MEGERLATKLMIYETVVPVSNARHGNWYLELGTDYAFCRNVNSVPLMAAEFASAALEYAIVFRGGRRRSDAGRSFGRSQRRESLRPDASADQSRFRRTHGGARVLGRGPCAGQDIVGECARGVGAVGRTRTDLCSPRVDAKFRDGERSPRRREGAAWAWHERRSDGNQLVKRQGRESQPVSE